MLRRIFLTSLIETKDVVRVKQVTYVRPLVGRLISFDVLELKILCFGRISWTVFVYLPLHGNYGAVIEKRLRHFNFGKVSNQKSILSCKRAVCSS